ncbi:MAG: sensor histidine kinase [Eubacteriales bacterium]
MFAKQNSKPCLDGIREFAPRWKILLAALSYAAVIGVYVYFTLSGFYRFPSPWRGGAVLSLGVLILAALDCLEFRNRKSEISRPVLAALQVMRAVIVGVFSLNDGLGFIPETGLLLIPFLIFFFIPGRSYGLSALVWILYLIMRVHIFSGVSVDPAWSDGHKPARDVTFFVIFALTAAFIFSLNCQARRERANRLRVEKLLSELEVSHRQLKDYAEKVAEMATIEERNRLARDIHDSLGHYLTIINVQLEKALAFRSRDPEEADRSVWNAKHLAGEALKDIRRSVRALRNARQPFSLIEDLTGLVKNMCSDQLFVDLKIEGSEEGFSEQSLIALFRAAQEGLTNIQKHANATQAVVNLEFGAQQAGLYIADNGRGFNPGNLEREGDHYGLHGVRERLELVRGSIDLESAPGKGTKLYFSVPKNH